MVKSQRKKRLNCASESAPSWRNEAATEATSIPSVRSDVSNFVSGSRLDVMRMSIPSVRSDVSNFVSGSRSDVPFPVHLCGLHSDRLG